MEFTEGTRKGVEQRKKPNDNTQTKTTNGNDETNRESSVFVNKFSGFRLWGRNKLHPYVDRGTDLIVDIQKGQSKLKTTFWNFMSIVGSHDFFLAFFPLIIYGFGHVKFGAHLVWRATFGIYLGNVLKDYYCLPRPKCPPATQLNNSGNKEFGFPSTHGATSVTLPFYALLAFQEIEFSSTFLMWLTIAIIYMCLLSYSRLYLGMHTLPDVIGGVMLGFVVLGICWAYDTFLESNHIVANSDPVTVYLLGILLLLIHPEPFGPCPCFEDSACFVGSSAGFTAGITRGTVPIIAHTFSPHLLVARWVIASSLLFLGRSIFKPLLRTVAYTLFNSLGLPTARFIKPGDNSDRKPLRSPKWNLDVLLKYNTYFIMCQLGTELAPPLINMLGMW